MTHDDQMNDNIQQAPTPRALWQITQSMTLRDLRVICDLNGHDAEFMTQAECLAAIHADKWGE